MALHERALSWTLGPDALVGVLAEPAGDACDLGVVVVVGGPQCRSGSHRMFTLLARALARQGHTSLRFDVRGMGDSSGAQRSFEQLSEDIGSAIDVLMRECPQLQGVVLWGLCDGASAALLYADETGDARVRGMCLANPWVRSEATQARTQIRHYYGARLRDPAFWRKLLRGGVGLAALRGWWQARSAARAAVAPAAQPGFQARMARGWARLPVPRLLLMSGKDYTAREFDELAALDRDWGARLKAPLLQRVDLAQADHTFSDPKDLEAAWQACAQWLARLARLAQRPSMDRQAGTR
jgi:exosortase A-associated hydrolase 1